MISTLPRIGIVLLTALTATCARPACAAQANTIHNTQPGANGTATCTATNSDATQAAWYLGGNAQYSATPHPWIPGYVTYAFNQSPVDRDLGAIVSKGTGYSDARLRVHYSVYEYHTGTGEQTVINTQSSPEFDIPAGDVGGEFFVNGPSAFQVDTTWYRVRYKVSDGINTPSTGAAWTGDL
jgi:hypothetical protein